MAIDLEMSMSVLFQCKVDLNSNLNNKVSIYLVDSRLYFSDAMYPQRNNDIAAMVDSLSTSGCKQGTIIKFSDCDRFIK